MEMGRDNRGSGRSGRGRGGTGSNGRGGGGRDGNYPRNQHHQQGQYQSGGGGRRGGYVGRGCVPTQTGNQQRGNRPGQRGKGGGAYRPHQHGGQGVGPTRVESSEGCVVGGGGGAGGGRGVWTGRPWGTTSVPGQSQPRSLPAPVIPNIQSLEISEQKPQSTLRDALQEISLLAAKVLVTKLISSLKPNI